jgi:hypothetical protein
MTTDGSGIRHCHILAAISNQNASQGPSKSRKIKTLHALRTFCRRPTHRIHDAILRPGTPCATDRGVAICFASTLFESPEAYKEAET